MKQKEIKALMVAPKEYPKVVTLKTDLDSLQKAVSIGAGYQGLIEIIHLEKGVILICNVELIVMRSAKAKCPRIRAFC